MKERMMDETGKVEEHSEHLIGVLSKKPGFVSCTLKDRLDGDKVYFVDKHTTPELSRAEGVGLNELLGRSARRMK